MAYRISSALGHSSRPPARMGKIISPGENHVADTRAAPMPIPTTATASTKAIRRFRVMNCRLIRPRNDCTAAAIADHGRRPELETMMAKLYRLIKKWHERQRLGYEVEHERDQ